MFSLHNRFNKLLLFIRGSLVNVKRAVIGEIAMIPQIESVHLAISIGKIPDSWKGKSYASLKPLGSYINDLMARLQFLQNWIDNGEPTVYWFSGFYFTQSFITGILQNHSRKHKLQIDLVTIQFHVTEFESEVRESNEVGVFIRVSQCQFYFVLNLTFKIFYLLCC